MGKKSKAYVVWMAWRYLTSKSRRTGLSFMTMVSIFGVAIGVAALIIVLSVMGGFEQDLKDKMLRGQPHLELLNKKSAVAGFSLQEVRLDDLRRLFPEATDVEPYTQADVVLKQKRHIASGILFGVDADRDGHLWGFGNAITEGDLKGIGKSQKAGATWDAEKTRPGIALGEQLADQLGAELGDEIAVLSPQAGVGSVLGGGTVSRTFVVVGKFRTGLFNYDAKWAVVSLPEGRKFMPDYDPSLDEEQYVSGIAINVTEPTSIEKSVNRVFAAKSQPSYLTDIEPLTWQKANKSLLFALKLEKFAMGSILMLIVVVAGFSISGTMMMTVFHKRGQVSLLRSLGMSQRDIARLFLTHGATIGTVGILVGLLFGLLICMLIKSFQFIDLPRGVYHLKSLPCKWLWLDYAVICGAAWVFSLVASTYPALMAARQDPGQGLRYL